MERDPSQLYYCDPSKNVECRKTNCYKNGGPCYLVADERFAGTDGDGWPLRNDQMDTLRLLEVIADKLVSQELHYQELQELNEIVDRLYKICISHIYQKHGL